jgi:hypothetical protein
VPNLDRRLGQKGDVSDAERLLNSELIDQLKRRTADEIRKWYVENRSYLHRELT